ncbi:MAG: hypothetical protein DRJ42_22570 [Deltaproteobacteria bacterium]|nr:MAG: hypothetical protein DRJ42_22570 [Deltaproteobacteria bacterium]
MSGPNPGRMTAAMVLMRVADDGAWAAPSLAAEFQRTGAEGRDRALATEIVYGTLRVLPEIDAALAAFLRAPAAGMEPFARATLRTGAYQLLHLSAPVHAIVSDSVSIARNVRGQRLAGLVNAVLRKVAKTRPDDAAPPTQLVLPDWVTRVLDEDLGEERARAFTTARPLPPAIGVRVVRGDREDWMEAIRDARPQAEVRAGAVSPDAILVQRAGDPRRLPGMDAGDLTIQEQGAQMVGLLAGARPGEAVIDACAGRGGKTAQLAQAVGGGGRVVAMDIYEEKLERLHDELSRTGVEAPVEVEVVDLSVGTAGLDGTFDRVLVDAPCTGIGTLHRRPEILLRLSESDPARMAELQTKILTNACRLAKPGATVIYAVCSPTHAEGAGVISRVLEEHADLVEAFEDGQGLWPDLGIEADADGICRIGPWNGDCDAYQVARLRRKPA